MTDEVSPALRLASKAAPRRPYWETGAALLAFIAVSQAIPATMRGFGGNVPPLFARLDPSAGPLLLAPAALVILAWFGLPWLTGRSTPLFLSLLIVAGWGFAVLLSMQADGVSGLTAPVARPLDYLANASLVDELGPREFARRYPMLGERLSLHARTHPPGAVLAVWGMGKLARGSVVAFSLIVAFIGMVGAIPTFGLARARLAEGSERTARLAAVLFACSPAVILFSATSVDAVFMTMIAVAMVALIRAAHSARWAVAAGVLGILALAMTYAAAMLVPLAAGFALLAAPGQSIWDLVRRGALAVGAAILSGFVLRAALGIDMVASFRSALTAHLNDPSATRPLWYWIVGNIAALLIVAGMGQAALLVGRVRERWSARRAGLEAVLVGTLVVATASGMFRGETDHIWLFLIPLISVAAAGENVGRREMRFVAVAGLAQAVLMEVLLNTFW